MGKQYGFGRPCKGGHDVRDVLMFHVFKELARPDQIKRLRGGKWSVREVMVGDTIGNCRILNCGRATFDAKDLAARLLKVPG